MMPENRHSGSRDSALPSDRPFPRACPECGREEVYPAAIAYDAEVKHDGRMHAFHIPAIRGMLAAVASPIRG